MAARDNVIFHATIANGTAAGTVVPLSLLYGIENVRTGYGTPVLKNIRGVYSGIYGGNDSVGIPVEIKNSQWVDSAGLRAQAISGGYSLARNSLAFMRGRDKVLSPNTSWTVNATLEYAAAAGDIYVIFEIEYSDVPGKPTAEVLAGAPVMKKAINAAVTAAANVPTSIGTFDNLLQGVTYVLSEVSMNAPSGSGSTDAARCYFLVLEGFANQRGLVRVFPVRTFGIAEQIEGSVELTKQTYNLSIISSAALSAAPVEFDLEMIASAN